MKKTLTIALTLQVVVIFCFLYFAYQADEAMGKDGVGNLELWKQYNNYAGIAFYSVIGLWITTLLTAIVSKTFKIVQGQLAIGLPPLMAITGWVSLWFF